MGLAGWLKSSVSRSAGPEIPESELEQAKRHLERFCQKRVPAPVRDKLSYSYRVEGNSLNLFEHRPHFMLPDVTTELFVARFRHEGEDRWTLMWSDRDEKLHPYDGFESVSFQQALEEMSEDPTGIFFG
jgi:hypothetical protein